MCMPVGFLFVCIYIYIFITVHDLTTSVPGQFCTWFVRKWCFVLYFVCDCLFVLYLLYCILLYCIVLYCMELGGCENKGQEGGG